MVLAGHASVRTAREAIKDISLGMSLLSASPRIVTDANAETTENETTQTTWERGAVVRETGAHLCISGVVWKTSGRRISGEIGFYFKQLSSAQFSLAECIHQGTFDKCRKSKKTVVLWLIVNNTRPASLESKATVVC